VGIANDFSHQKSVRDDLEQQATYDSLTGAVSRLYIEQLLGAEVDRVTRYGRPSGIILLDIDHFKAINDRLGHAVGDTVLSTLGEVLGQRLREADSLGRWGGEEFLVLLPETDLTGTTHLGEELRKAVAEHPFPNVRKVTISLGVAEIQPGEEMTGLMERLDDALYAAKRAGRDRTQVARPAPGGRWI
jgi:diguanylate cyclase (GGDEF)-like protein